MTNVAASTVVPATEPGGRMFQTCVNVLATIDRIFTTAGVELPKVQFVSDGSVAYDSELVAIEALRLRPGKPGVPSLAAVDPGTSYSLETVVHIIRPVITASDQGDAPTADELSASAKQLLTDWWVLHQGILLGRAQGSRGAPGSLQGAPYRDIMVQEIVPYGPAGGMGGTVATLVCELV